MVQREHAHVAGEPLDADGGARLGDEQVEQVVGVVERALTLDRQVVAELARRCRGGALEVGGELSGVAAGRARARRDRARAPGRSGRCQPEDEERRGDARDARTDDRDVGGDIVVERADRPIAASCAIHGEALA